jgi:hypothetical protein
MLPSDTFSAVTNKGATDLGRTEEKGDPDAMRSLIPLRLIRSDISL